MSRTRPGARIESIYPGTGEVIARAACGDARDHRAGPRIGRRRRRTSGRAPLRPSAAASCAAPPTSSARATASSPTLETLDTGKPLQETLVADAASGADALEYFGGIAGGDHRRAHRRCGGDFVYTRREPLGVCVGIGAWNYPTQIACWKAAPALACGNAMIFKPSEIDAALRAEARRDPRSRRGCRRALFNVVQGHGDVGARAGRASARRQGVADRLGADRPQGHGGGGRGR